MPEHPEHHVMTREGDASAEIEALLRSLGSAEHAGLHRHFYVIRANQTVVMTRGSDTPLAEALRLRPGWREPGSGSGL